MTDDVDQIKREFETAIAAAVAAASTAFDRLRTPAPAPAPTSPQDAIPNDLIPAAEAAEIAKRAKATMGTWCRKNPLEGDKGFAVKMGECWFVSKSRLTMRLARGSRD